MENIFFHDFGKAAFGTLDLFLESSRNCTVEIAVGECRSGNRVDRNPGKWRFINIQTVNVQPGVKKYRFPLPKRPQWCPGGLLSPLPDDEIAPFRYVEIIGDCQVQTLRRNEIFPAEFHDEDSSFVSSCEQLNQVWEFCKYSIKATAAFGLFVDGERERRPYEGDTYINQLGWFCCCADPEIPRKTIDYLLKNPTWPTEWLLLMPIIVHDYLLYTGDRESIKQWMDILEERLLKKYVSADGLLYITGSDPRDIVDWPERERDGYVFGKTNLIPNCYRYGALLAMQKLTGDPAYYHEAELLRESIRRKMLINGRFVDSPETGHTALHSRFFPLFFGVGTAGECNIPENTGMKCSVYGAQFLLDAMFDHHMDNRAMAMICNEGERSWLNMIKQGSTISMEAWSNETKPNQDWNHAWGAAPANIIPRKIAGITPIEPGFRKFAVDPHPVDLADFSAKFPIPDGRYIYLEYDSDSLNLTVPEGSCAVFKKQELQPGIHSIKLQPDNQNI